MSARILSIAYDQSLLATRELLFLGAGYNVLCAVGYVEAMEQAKRCGYDLAVICHSMPLKDKEAIIQMIGKECPVPVLALLKLGESKPRGAQFSIEAADGPEALLSMVRFILENRATASAE
jgi:DNA-binding response OmpR family regulator